jgi:hypothetical protein
VTSFPWRNSRTPSPHTGPLLDADLLACFYPDIWPNFSSALTTRKHVCLKPANVPIRLRTITWAQHVDQVRAKRLPRKVLNGPIPMGSRGRVVR